MKIRIFGYIIRTRKSLEKILLAAAKKNNKLVSFHHFVAIYNTGLFGIVIYKDSFRFKDERYFLLKAHNNTLILRYVVETELLPTFTAVKENVGIEEIDKIIAQLKAINKKEGRSKYSNFVVYSNKNEFIFTIS